MYIDDDLYKAFLEEMNSLEAFRMVYASQHHTESLDAEDPDTRRLIEALALFSARTRLAGIRNITATRQRIFQQFFSYLMSPVPAMGMISAEPTGRFTETAVLPGKSEIALSSGGGKFAIFTTLHPLRILPISLYSFNILPLSKGYRFVLNIRSAFSRNDSIGLLPLHINYLNNFEASLKVLYALKKYLVRAFVSFDSDVDETTRGTKCKVFFGSIPQDEDEGDTLNPLERERLFFHFPWQELFASVLISDQPRNWDRFSICFDVSSKWPRNLILNKDMFQLFAVPVINLRRFPAEPLIYDGVTDCHLIRYPDQDYGFELHSIKGVYEVQKKGMVPIKSGILSGSGSSYELEDGVRQDGTKLHYLRLHSPDAFESSKTISVDALWFQPWFANTINQRLKVAPFTRNVTGIKWNIYSYIVPHYRNEFLEDIEGFLHLMTLTHKVSLTRDNIIDILNALGPVQHSRFAKIIELLEGVRLEKSAQGNRGAEQLKYIYWLKFSEFNSSMLPIIQFFSDHLQKVLDAWVSQALVEVKIEGIDRMDAI